MVVSYPSISLYPTKFVSCSGFVVRTQHVPIHMTGSDVSYLNIATFDALHSDVFL